MQKSCLYQVGGLYIYIFKIQIWESENTASYICQFTEFVI